MRRLGGALASALGIGLLAAAPVASFDLDGGCSMTMTSTDASGATIDTASGPGAGGTQSDPFMIDWEGSVSWNGNSGETVFNNHSWQVYVYRIPTPVRGGHPNDDNDTTGTGSAGVEENAPFRTTGLYHVSGDIAGDGGAACRGSAWFKLIGDPTATVPWLFGIAVTLVGLAVAWWSRPTWLGGPAE
jgi:hypothetical protein